MHRTLSDVTTTVATSGHARAALSTALLLAAFAGIARGQQFQPYLAADINTAPLTTGGSQPGGTLGQDGMCSLGAFSVFSAYDREHGTELWYTDGTPGGTHLVKDIQPGSRSSAPLWMARLGERAVFAAYTDESGTELWVTDGTGSGTAMIAELAAGTSGISPQRCRSAGNLVFFVTAGTSQLWRTDGTPAGTFALTPANSQVNQLEVAGGRAFFNAATAAEGNELWSSDGTVAGTTLVEDINPGSTGSYFNAIFPLGNRVVFCPNTSDTGAEPWVSDGTAAGTFLLRDIEEGPYSTYIEEAVAFEGRLYFASNSTASGYELWQTDGTAAGTTIAADISPGPDSSNPDHLVATEHGVVFQAFEASVGRNLFSVSSAGLVKLTSYGWSDNFYASESVGADGKAFLLSNNPPSNANYNLWSSDGTVAGTRVIRQNVSYTNMIACEIPTGALLNINDGVTGSEPWRTDGTPGDVAILRDINTGVGESSPVILSPAVGTLLFTASDGVHGREPWRVDVNGNAQMVADLSPGDGSMPVYGSQTLGEQAVLWILYGPTGAEPWISDATASGTHLITDVRPGASSSFVYPNSNNLPQSVSGSDRLYYAGTASGSTQTTDVIATNGTAAGTVVLDINPKPNAASIGTGINGAMISRNLIFAADNGVNGPELWRTDGTLAGTAMIKEFIAGAAGGLSLTDNRFISFGNKVLFGATDNVIGSELWITDGTAAGTALVKDIRPGSAGSQPNPLAVIGNKVIFLATTTAEGRELWVTDGTAAGTVFLKDTNPGAGSAAIVNRPVVAGNKAFFAISTPASGRELWVTDGTPGGTFMVSEIRAGVLNGLISTSPFLDTAGNRVFFQADDGVHGVEPWVSDGTPAGTRMVADIWPGLSSSYPTSGRVLGGTIYFDAYRPAEGEELWAIKACPADFDNSGFIDHDDYDAFVQAFVDGLDSADFDGSGFVDESDFTAFVNDFDAGC